MVVLALTSFVYLPLLRDVGTSTSQMVLRLVAPVARTIISQVDGDYEPSTVGGGGEIINER